jgi:hypothetical protein
MLSSLQAKDIQTLLDKKIDYQTLPEFETDQCVINPKGLDIVVEALVLLQRAHCFRGLNEAGRSAFITLILSLAVVNLASDVVIEPQYRLRKGQSGQIIPDWVIKRDDEIILVVEAKAHELNAGVSQHIRQLYEAYKENNPSEADKWRIVRGLVTTADKWVFIVAAFNGEQCKFIRGDKSPWELPLNNQNMDTSRFKFDLQLLVEQLVWFLSEEF